jgi:hypothetical protein
MYHQTVICAAVAIGMSCIASDASARGGGGGQSGGGGGGGGKSVVTAPAPGVRSNITRPSGRFAATGVRVMPRIIGVGGPTGGGSVPMRPEIATGVLGPTGGGAAGAVGGGAAAGARYYAPASYYSSNAAACGHYPYPPCGAPAR